MNRPLIALLFAAASGFALVSASERVLAQAQTPDLVLYNANILTVDDTNTTVQAIAVMEGRIAAVGGNELVLELAGPSTIRLDLDGKTVIPGIVDSHTHLRGVAANIGKLNVTEAVSIGEVLAIIRRHADSIPPGTWIETATGWQPSNLAENRLPTRSELDDAATDHPVFLKKGYQDAVVNSMALQLAGITEENAGENFLRDDSNRLSGEIHGSLNDITDAQPAVSDEQVLQSYIEAMRIYNGYGVTSLRDAALGPQQVALFRQLADENRLSVRINAVGQIYPSSPLQVDQRIWGNVPLSRGDWFTHDSLKVIGDGGVADALLRDEYAWNDGGIAGYTGRHVTSMKKIEAMSEWACETGRKLAVHTIGDGMIDSILDYYESINEDCPVGKLGWTLEHVALVTEDQIDRLQNLEISVTTQTGLNYSLAAAWRKYWGEQRMARSVPNRMLIDKGMQPGGGTDANTGPLNTFIAVWADVTRQTKNGLVGVEQAVSPIESLRMHTIWAAKVLGSDEFTGSIEIGKFADLAVLDRNILTIPEDEIRDIQVVMTLVNGEIVYKR